MMKRLLTIISMIMLLGGIVIADDAQVSVRWEFPIENMNGSPLIDLAGARIYYGIESGKYTDMIEVPGGIPGGEGTLVITGLVDDVVYYLTGTAYNEAGLESVLYEPEAVKVAKNIQPPPPPRSHGTFAVDSARRKVNRRILMEIIEITQEWHEIFNEEGEIIGGEWLEVGRGLDIEED